MKLVNKFLVQTVCRRALRLWRRCRRTVAGTVSHNHLLLRMRPGSRRLRSRMSSGGATLIMAFPLLPGPLPSGLAGAVFHAELGSHYASKGFGMPCPKLGVAQSMGAVGTSMHNALAPSFNATLNRGNLARRSPLGITPSSRARGVPVDHPLQHHASALVLRLSQPCRIYKHSHIP